jgi:hypothetical protein
MIYQWYIIYLQFLKLSNCISQNLEDDIKIETQKYFVLSIELNRF